MTASMNGWLGQRIPTVSPPDVTMSGMRIERGRTRVNGPGQKAAASLPANSGHSRTQERAIARSATWTIMGFRDGRPFVA